MIYGASHGIIAHIFCITMTEVFALLLTASWIIQLSGYRWPLIEDVLGWFGLVKFISALSSILGWVI